MSPKPMLSGAYASCGVNHAGQVKGQTYEKSTLNLSVFMASWLNKHFMQQSCSLPACLLVYMHKTAGMVYPDYVPVVTSVVPLDLPYCQHFFFQILPCYHQQSLKVTQWLLHRWQTRSYPLHLLALF